VREEDKKQSRRDGGMSLQEFFSYVTAVGSISGLLSGIYLVISKLREGPRPNLSIQSCRYRGDETSIVTTELTIRNRGNRPTSIESFSLKACSNHQKLESSAVKLYDLAELQRFYGPYRPDNPPSPDRYLPIPLDGDNTIRLLAEFELNGVITAPQVDCNLEMKCTHKQVVEACRGFPAEIDRTASNGPADKSTGSVNLSRWSTHGFLDVNFWAVSQHALEKLWR